MYFSMGSPLSNKIVGGERTRRLTVLLALAFTLALVPAVPAQAKKPLVGTMALEFNLLWPGPQADIPDWAGNITFNGDEYRMLFFAIGSGKAFTEDPGKVHFFSEIWAIYNTTVDDFTTLLPSNEKRDWAGWLPSATPVGLVLWGYDAGVVAWQNDKYRMNGNVTEASKPFEAWEGRNVHMSGIIEWQEIDGKVAPHHAPGTFRIN